MQTRTASGSLKRKAYHEGEQNEYLKSTDVYIQKPRKKPNTSVSHNGSSAIASKQKGKGKAVTSICRRRNVGKLAKLLDMPMDIFCEISRHLGPLDLLQLSRSSKSFNRILITRDSKPIWRAARGSYPQLPECPPDLSEPEYAKLVFLKECHVCLASRVMKVDYELRTRLCHRCRTNNIQKGDVLLRTVPGLTEELLECLPSEHAWYLKGSCKARSFFKGSAERIVAQFIKAGSSTLSRQEAQKARDAFTQSKKALLPAIEMHAKEMTKWTLSQMYAKQNSDNDAIQRRREAIRMKLLELGHTEDDIPPLHYSVEWNNILQQPRDLTPRIWNNIRPKLENIISGYKTFREERKRLLRQNARRQELHSYLQPLLAELAEDSSKFKYLPVDTVSNLPTCIAAIKQNDFSDEITEERWLQIKAQVLIEVHDAIEQFERGLITSITSLDSKHFPKSLIVPEDVKEFLFAPSTYFNCTTCKVGQRYPQLRKHSCGLHNGFVFDPLRTVVAQAILASLPETDHSEADELMAKFVRCNTCSIRMPWGHLLRHFHPEGMKHPPSFAFHSVAPNTHVLENEIIKGKPLISIEEAPDEEEHFFDPFQDYDVSMGFYPVDGFNSDLDEGIDDEYDEGYYGYEDDYYYGYEDDFQCVIS